MTPLDIALAKNSEASDEAAFALVMNTLGQLNTGAVGGVELGSDLQGGSGVDTNPANTIRVRFQIIGNARIDNVGKSQSCMVSKLPIIWKQTVRLLVSMP